MVGIAEAGWAAPGQQAGCGLVWRYVGFMLENEGVLESKKKAIVFQFKNKKKRKKMAPSQLPNLPVIAGRLIELPAWPSLDKSINRQDIINGNLDSIIVSKLSQTHLVFLTWMKL